MIKKVFLVTGATLFLMSGILAANFATQSADTLNNSTAAEVAPTITPEPSPTVEPSPTEPTPEPSPTEEPSPVPSPTEPTPEPSPTEPTPEPSPSPVFE